MPAKKLPRLARKSDTAAYWGLAVIMAGLYAFLSGLTPFSLDDWTFMGNWRDDAEGGNEFSFPAWQRFFYFIRSYDNGRIANAMSPLSTMFSPWKELFPILTGTMLAAAVVLLQRFSTGSRSTFYLALAWGCMILFLPWRDTLFVRDYSLNYIWGAAVTLFFLWLLRKVTLRSASGNGTRNAAVTALCILTAVIAGGWHEGFAIPSLCGLGLLMLAGRFRFPVRFYAIVSVYLVSALLFMFSPGLTARIEMSVEARHNIPYIRNYLVLIPLLCLAAGCCFGPYGRKALRNALKRPETVVMGGIMAAGYVIAVCTTNTPRSYFWPDMATIGLGLCILSRLEFIPRRMLRPSSLLVAFLCIAQTCSAILWQWRYKKETDEIMSMLEESPTGTVFHDLSLPENPPLYTLGMPVGHMWRSPWHYRALQSWEMKPTVAVVPEGLRYAKPSALTPPYSKIKPGTARMTVPEFLDDGRLMIPFITEGGDTLVYFP